MRYGHEVNAPGHPRQTFTVELQDGVTLEVAEEDGGGQFLGEDPLGNEPWYEVHFIDLNDEFITVPQRDIKRVFVTATGEEVEFGNPYMEGHPRPRELDETPEDMDSDVAWYGEDVTYPEDED